MTRKPPTPPASVWMSRLPDGDCVFCLYRSTSKGPWTRYVLAPRPSRIAKLEAAALEKLLTMKFDGFQPISKMSDDALKWHMSLRKSAFRILVELEIARRASARRTTAKRRGR